MKLLWPESNKEIISETIERDVITNEIISESTAISPEKSTGKVNFIWWIYLNKQYDLTKTLFSISTENKQMDSLWWTTKSLKRSLNQALLILKLIVVEYDVGDAIDKILSQKYLLKEVRVGATCIQ